MSTYDFETGLPDDFDMEITNAYYQFNPKATGQDGNPRIALYLEGKAEGGTYETPTVLEGETALTFTVGDKWMISEDGALIVDEGGRADRAPHRNSALARIVGSAVKAGAPLKDRGEATDARIWPGLRLHFKREKVNMGTEIGERDVLFVNKFLGTAEGGSKATSGARAATPADTSSDGGNDVELVKAAAGGAIFKRLEKLAKESDDYDTWASEAADLPKIKDDEGAQDIILDPDRGQAVYEALRG